MINANQLENARLAIMRRLTKGLWNLVTHTEYEEFPVVKKSPESRYGGGKSNINHFAFKFTTGIVIFELFPTNPSMRFHQVEAEAVFMAGRIFLPIQTVVVPQGRVDEYTVFK